MAHPNAPVLPASFVATDMAGSTGDVTRSFPVEVAEVQPALARHQPHVVLASWMSISTERTGENTKQTRWAGQSPPDRRPPRVAVCRGARARAKPGNDWTAWMRKTPSVLEYVLIGEVDMGVSGRPWETWGVPTGREPPSAVPPFRADGFDRWDLGALSVLQSARSDTPLVRFHSSTVVFRRHVTAHDEL